MQSAQILVTGVVQGVWFRDFVKRNAISLKLNGWVKNNPDGSVNFSVEGEKKIVLWIQGGIPIFIFPQ